MAKFSSKHKDVERMFEFSTFTGGYMEDIDPSFLSSNQLSEALNVKYLISENELGEKKVTLKKRQGTVLISNSSLPLSSDIMACTKYIAQSKYIIATSTRLYYLDSSGDPVEIGNSFLDGIPTFTEFNGKLIIHDGGITKYWDGTTSPVLDTNYGKIKRLFQDELLGTGDNVVVIFSGTLDHPAAFQSSITITFTDTTTKTITDDGVGRLIGNVSAAVVGNITGAADNGGGLIRITQGTHGYSTGNKINIQGVTGTTEANNDSDNPTWTITVIDPDTYDLDGSVYINGYSANGTASRNTIVYSTGVYWFTADGAPDSSTTITCDYYQRDGAAKSKAGLVRASRLYTWGDSDNLSRLTYSIANDETSTDTSSGGGYLDVDLLDGDELLGGLNFETSLLLFKTNSLHRTDAYPGDEEFKVEKITDDLGTVSHRTPLFEGEIVSFVSDDGWQAMHPSQRYGDIQKGISLSTPFRSTMARYNNDSCMTCYNRIDKQLWIALYDGSLYLQKIYVANLGTGGQISKYKFSFLHSCFNFVDGEMLIGGRDGNLYKLDSTDTIFTDNGVSYSSDTKVITGFLDWGTPNNVKHNKKIFIDISGGYSSSYTIDIYRNSVYKSIYNKTVSIASSSAYIYDSTDSIYGSDEAIGRLLFDTQLNKKFNYKTIMVGIENLTGDSGVEILGLKFKSALIGDEQ